MRQFNKGMINFSVPDPKHFGTDPEPNFDIRAFLDPVVDPYLFSACLESSCLANF
jgi:hypothetical protein